MTADDVLAVLAVLEAAGVPTWLDGGWGVDALLGTQTRAHDDLDLVVADEHVEALCLTLARHGFTVLADERPTRLVLGDATRSIDLHPVRFDEEGGGWQSLPDKAAFRYPPEGFAGVGVVAGRRVACLSAEVQDLCHRGYDPDEKDDHDMRLLHAHCDLPTPCPAKPAGTTRSSCGGSVR
jgi:lincosamide nucleotidyltransferase A/C/D/E